MAKAKATPKKKTKSPQEKMNDNMLKLFKQTADQNALQTQVLTELLTKQHKGSVPQRVKRTSVHLYKAGAAILNMD